jgi:hypothetical protein
MEFQLPMMESPMPPLVAQTVLYLGMTEVAEHCSYGRTGAVGPARDHICSQWAGRLRARAAHAEVMVTVASATWGEPAAVLALHWGCLHAQYLSRREAGSSS